MDVCESQQVTTASQRLFFVRSGCRLARSTKREGEEVLLPVNSCSSVFKEVSQELSLVTSPSARGSVISRKS